MNGTYKCLSCGMTMSDEEAGGDGGYVTKCPRCGRDMYRSNEGDQSSSSAPVTRGTAHARMQAAVPSRYAGSGAPSAHYEHDEEFDDDYNPVVLPHTPFVVILGFIFAFIFPPAGLIISIMAFRLVNESAAGVRGRGLAIAGIAVGGLLTFLMLVGGLAGG